METIACMAYTIAVVSSQHPIFTHRIFVTWCSTMDANPRNILSISFTKFTHRFLLHALSQCIPPFRGPIVLLTQSVFGSHTMALTSRRNKCIRLEYCLKSLSSCLPFCFMSHIGRKLRNTIKWVYSTIFMSFNCTANYSVHSHTYVVLLHHRFNISTKLNISLA